MKDIVGAREMPIELPDGSTVEDVLRAVERQFPRIAEYRGITLTAVNEEYVGHAARVADGDEVAIFPPVSGGSTEAPQSTIERERELYAITTARIDAQQIARSLQRGEDGAVCVFEGIVRNNSKGKRTRYLVYEAYETMALRKMEEIGMFVRQAWDVDGVALIHRLGHMDIGETSVAIIVTSAHRRAAFDACEYAIDRLKKVVPIWKKEFFEDGEVWIEGQN